MLSLPQLIACGVLSLAIGIAFWRKQAEIRVLEKRCRDKEREAETLAQECEKQTKALKVALQERNDRGILHKAAIAERNLAHSEILMLRPQLQLSERERAKLVVQNRQLRDLVDVSHIAEWPIIAAIPAQKPEGN